MFGYLIFLMLRLLYNGCGGRLPSKYGYSSVSYWASKITFYVFGIVTLVALVFSLMGNVMMANGVRDATAVYDSVVTPLEDQQAAFLDGLAANNSALLQWIRSDLVANLSAEFGTKVDKNVYENMLKVNFTKDAQKIMESTKKIDVALGQMRENFVVVASIYSDDVPDLLSPENMNAIGDQQSKDDFNYTLSTMAQYYNVTTLNNMMLNVSVTLSAVVPADRTKNSFDYLGNMLSRGLDAENYPVLVQASLDQLKQNLTEKAASLKSGADRCNAAVVLKTTIPAGGENLSKFGNLVAILNALSRIAIPVLYATAGLIALGVLVGGVAWPKSYYGAMYWIATFFVIGMVVSWAANGFFIPATILTDDACSRTDMFQSNTAIVKDLNGSVESTTYIPACKSCDYVNLFTGWNDFAADFMNSTREDFKLHSNEDGKVANQDSPSVSEVLEAMLQVETLISQTSVNAPPRNVPWRENLDAFTKMSEASGNAMMIQLSTQLKNVSDELVASAGKLSESYVAFKAEYANLMKMVDQIQEELKIAKEKAISDINGVTNQVQQQLNGVMAKYQPAPPETASCSANATNVIDPDTYGQFQTALCGKTLVGLSVTWILLIVIALLLIPLLITSLKGYKLLGFARIMDDSF